MKTEQLNQLKNLAQIVKDERSELKPFEYKQIELSEFQQAASPEAVLNLIDELKDALDSVDFYKRRVDLLQQWQSKMRDPERTIACDIIANGQTLPPEHAGSRYAVKDFEINKVSEPDIEAAYEMGAKGAPPTESERLLFEAWMRGHCWAVVDTWNGRQYDDRPEYREAKVLDPQAMLNRQLFAAWRDSAAIRYSSESVQQNEPNVNLSAMRQRSNS